MRAASNRERPMMARVRYVLSSKDQEGRMYLHTSNMSLFMFNYSKSNKINIGQSYNRLGNLLSHCIILKIRIFKKIDTK